MANFSPSLGRSEPIVRRSFHTLDALRGVAAIFIVARHVPDLFGNLLFPESFLAVDLFFVLSGYVLAHSYDAKLAAGGYAGRFIRLRFIRLYPLYLLGLIVGAAHVGMLLARHELDWSVLRTSVTALTSLLFVPIPAQDGVLVEAFNVPTWTLFIELVANFAFAYFHRRLTTRILLAVAGVSAAVMVAAVVLNGSLDARNIRIFIGLARVGFSFSIGVLLCRAGIRHAVRPTLAAFALVLLVVILSCNPPPAWRPATELIATLLFFPAIVWWAAGLEPHGRVAAKVMTSLGLASYAVYVLHEPLGFLVQSISKRALHINLSSAAPWSGLGYVVALIAISLALDRFYDQPIRGWLRRNFVPR